MLTRKHFKALAAILAEHRPCGDECYSFNLLRSAIADYCGRENPNFDRRKFYAVCNGKVRKAVHYTSETCPGKPCGSECDHVGFIEVSQ
jgi:hypothetical protein